MRDLKKGDQLRVLGEKNEDATRITAERAVFGSFRTVAGTVMAVDTEAGEIKIKDLQSGKAVLVKIKPDSQIKKMPSMGGMMGGMRPPGGGPPGAAPGGAGPVATCRWSRRPRYGRGGMRAGGPDVGQMLERMPSAKLEEIKVGESIVVSSTVGAKADEMTAIAAPGECRHDDCHGPAAASCRRWSGPGGARPQPRRRWHGYGHGNDLHAITDRLAHVRSISAKPVKDKGNFSCEAYTLVVSICVST